MGMVATDSQTRQADVAQGITLLVGSCLPVLGPVLLAAVLPRIQLHFSHIKGIEVLAPLVMTLPALVVALVSPLAGMLIDRHGRRRMLLLSAFFYAIFGTLPLWTDSFPLIFASRGLLGACEAGIITSCTALIGDYYGQVKREKWLALQTVATGLAATVFFAVGGVLGEHGWRTPFWLYSAGIWLVPIAMYLIWEPKHVGLQARPAGSTAESLPWASLSLIYPLTFIAAILFFLVPVQAGFMLNTLGVTSPQEIGQAIGLNSAAVLIGASSYRFLRRFGVAWLLFGEFLVAGAGMLWMSQAGTYQQFTLATMLNGLGCGAMLPTLITWCMSFLGHDNRGRGVGGWQAAFFIGQFSSPLVVAAVQAASGSLHQAVSMLAGVALAFALVGLAGARVVSRPSQSPGIQADYR
jgi:MFS family permease